MQVTFYCCVSTVIRAQARSFVAYQSSPNRPSEGSADRAGNISCGVEHGMHMLTVRMQQDNNYIQKWYRREMTLGESMWSVFGLHNETANIYSHLAGRSMLLAPYICQC